MSASPSRLNFFYLIFSWFLYNVFDKKSWQCYTVAQFRLSWAMPTPTPVTQLAFCFPDSENKGELWGTEAGFSQSGWVCMTLWWLQGAFLDQRSRWLSLNITVFLPTNGISRLCYGAMRNKGWLYEIQRREGGENRATPLGAAGCGLWQWLQTYRSVMTDMNRGTIMGWCAWS